MITIIFKKHKHYTLKSIGGSIYKNGLYCIQDTTEKRRLNLSESEKKRLYRESKFICLEKIYGSRYGYIKSKEFMYKFINIKEWNWTLYDISAAWEYKNKSFPVYAHFALVEFKQYLRELDRLLKLMN